MEKRIFELLRKNKIGHVKAWYLTHELLRLYNVVGQSEQLICECGNKLTDKEVYFGQCLQCDKNVEE